MKDAFFASFIIFSSHYFYKHLVIALITLTALQAKPSIFKIYFR
jgi:hypothetical protein